KTYPMLAISVKDRFPRAYLYRGPRRKGVRYFGPYPKAWAIRETLESLTRVFPIRTCAPGVFRRHEALGRPCLLGYIDRCSAPCVGKVTEAEHRSLVDQFSSFLAGNTEPVLRRVRGEMEDAAENLDFERAASLRDQLQAMEKAMEKQAVVFSDATDADVLAIEQDELEAAIQIFHVRGGRIHGQRGWVVEHSDESRAEMIGQFITQFYGGEAELVAAADSAGRPRWSRRRRRRSAVQHARMWALTWPPPSTRPRPRSSVVWWGMCRSRPCPARCWCPSCPPAMRVSGRGSANCVAPRSPSGS